ncbi:MAG: hypothetical protein ACXVRA_06145 [Gaiellaceae bacterium]
MSRYGRDAHRLKPFYRDLLGLDVVRRGGNNLAGRAVLFTSSPPGEEDHELFAKPRSRPAL